MYIDKKLVVCVAVSVTIAFAAGLFVGLGIKPDATKAVTDAVVAVATISVLGGIVYFMSKQV